MKKIVLTGGPCAGKTTVLEVLRREFAGQALVVPEVATILLSGGFPIPGKDVKWSLEWQAAFQSAVLPVQIQLEAAYELKAVEQDISLLICDRGRLDGAAYTLGGLEQFCRRYGVNAEEAFACYHSIFHLESTAVGDSEFYGKANNSNRFEDAEEARKLEFATRAAWQKHPNWTLVSCVGGLEWKIKAVCQALRWMIAERR